MRIYAEIEVRDIDCKLILTKGFEAHSYVLAFLDILSSHFTNTSRTITDTGGTARTVTAGGLDFRGVLNDSTQGIVVGTGTNAVAIGDTKLQTQVANGSGAGQMNHQLEEFLAPATSGTTRLYKITRIILNDSGGDITINECGIYSLTSGFKFCCVRDLVSPGVTVANLGTITVRYTIGVTA